MIHDTIRYCRVSHYQNNMYGGFESCNYNVFKEVHDSGHVTLYRLLVLGKCIEICI